MNYTALIVAAVVSFIIGMLWYSPMLFGKMYMKAVGHGDMGKGNMAGMMVLQFIFGLIQVWALWRVLRATSAATMNAALMTGGVLWLGFTVVNAWSCQMWENRNATGMWISVFCNLVTVMASAAILMSI